MKKLTWYCEICRKKRDDTDVSVVVSKVFLNDGFMMQRNIKYCNDTIECLEGATKLARQQVDYWRKEA